TRLPLTALLLLVVLMFVFAPRVNYSFSRENIVYEDESVYNYLRVEDTEDETILSTNVLFGVQSIKRKNADLTGLYYDYALGANYMVNGAEPTMLILGMGSGTFASQTLKYTPDFSIEGVEIDRKIIDLTYKYFDLDPSVKVVEYDGRAYLENAGIYDVIMVDAYQDITIPFQMSTVEFFRLVQKHLAPDGVMVVNLNMVADVKDNINDYLKDTINRVFRVVYECPTDGTNCILFASDNRSIMNVFDRKTAPLSGSIRAMMDRVRERTSLTEKGDRILTDDRAPVELLGMKVLDAMIQEELDYYRELFRGKSLSELIELLN
ncbi:MAG: fused MFS/spermidine synthase, partial [Clostridia bacterium]|nr:fused MFS/spermidine synthase [Clostridia bacterium]